MVRKTKKEAQATRTLILDAAKRVLLARGIARTSLLDVAKEAGVTRGAIYWHFADKEHLLRSIWHHLLDENTFFFQITDRREESDPLGFLVEQLFGFLKKLPENTRHQRLFRLFLHEYGLGSGQGVSVPFDYMEFQKNRLRSVAALLSTAVEKRQLPAGIDVRLGAIALLAYVDGLVPQYQRLVDEMEMQVEPPFLINGLMQLLRFGCISQVVSTPEPAARAPE